MTFHELESSMKKPLPSLPRHLSNRFLGGALIPLLIAMTAAGCATHVPEESPRATPAAPASYKEAAGQWAAAAPAESQPRGDWWAVFNDPILNDLVDRAGQNNTSIQSAAARLNEARALVRSVDSQRAPQVGVNAGANRSTVSPAFFGPPGQAVSIFNVGPTVSYEADLFGRLAKSTDAAQLDAQSREALVQSTLLLVQSQVATTYFAIRALDDERDLVRQTVAAYRDTLKLTRARMEAGDVGELDFARLDAEVASTESQALSLDRQRAELEHALAVLLGEVPTSFTLPGAAWANTPPVIPAGLPSTLLTRRPDVTAAQQAMLAAQTRVGVARTAWFPDVSLTANAGFASTDISDLFKWSARAWGVGALLSMPIFDGGRRDADVRRANAQWDQAAAAYREQVLTAFKDVEDQLSALRLLSDQATTQAQAVDASTRATRLSTARYRNGYVSQIELLDARRSELANRRVALQVRSAQFQATVGLIKALGGSWSTAG